MTEAISSFKFELDPTTTIGHLYLSKGETAEQIGSVQFGFQKLGAAAFKEIEAARKMREPESLGEADVQKYLAAVEKRLGFVVFVIDHLNNPDNVVRPAKSMLAAERDLCDMASSDGAPMPRIKVWLMGAKAKHEEWATFICLPEYGDRLEAAITKAFGNFAIAENIATQRNALYAMKTGATSLGAT